MSDAIIGVVGTLLGTIVGFVLSEVRYYRSQQEKRKWIKELVRTEIQYNLDGMSKIKLKDKLPTRSVQIWDSQLQSMPGVFQKSKFSGVHSFYVNLHNIYKEAGDSRIVNEETLKLISALVSNGNPVDNG